MTAHERERLAAWLDDELEPAERAEVEAHLAACEECAALLGDMEGVDALARAVRVEAPAGYFETLPGRVRARIESAPHAAAALPPGPVRWRVPVWTWAAAAALVLAVVTPLTLDRLNEAPPTAAPVRVPEDAARGSAPSLALEAKETDERDRDLEVRAKRETEARRPREELADEPRPALATAPAPEPIGVGPSAPRTPFPSSGGESPSPGARESGAPGRWASAPEAEAEAAWRAGEGTGRDETVGASDLRRQVAKDDVAAPEGTLGASPPTVAAPAKGRAASAQAVDMQEGFSARENKVVPEDSRVFARLVRVRPAGAAAWREHRDEWRAFVEAHPGSRHADEARVRAIEAGLEAWRAGADPEDLARARTDADAYVARDDAGQKERVRRALAEAEGG